MGQKEVGPDVRLKRMSSERGLENRKFVVAKGYTKYHIVVEARTRS